MTTREQAEQTRLLKGGIRTLGTDVSPYNGLANSARPLPIARNQSSTITLDAPSRAESECSVALYAPQYAPGKNNAGSTGSPGPQLSPQASSDTIAPIPWHEIGGRSQKIGGQPLELSTGQLNTPDAGLRLTPFSPGKLHLHPILERYGIATTIAEHNNILQQGETALHAPVDVTPDGTILYGIPQWKAAVNAGSDQILCIVHSLTAEQQLEWLLRRHRRRNGWNAYCRIMTALELEPKLKREALANQVVGGQNKGLSSLTKAEERHVRAGLARLAGACEAYIDYVKRLRKGADGSVLGALQSGEITIHQAWNWLKLSKSEQREILENVRAEKAVRIAYPRPRKTRVSIDPTDMERLWPAVVANGSKIECSVRPISGKRVEFRFQLDEGDFARMRSQGDLKLP